MAELASDNSVKVVVLTGTGKGFCSGGSVNDIIGPLLKMKGDELVVHAHDLQRGEEHAQLEETDHRRRQWYRCRGRCDVDAGLRPPVILGQGSRFSS